MRVIGLYSFKGGVGKTTTAVNLSFLAAERGDRTLLWDMDPQGASSYYLGSYSEAAMSMKKILAGKISASEYVIETPYPNLYMLPSRFANRKMDIQLNRVSKSRKQLTQVFTALKKDFAWIFLDCPSNISLTSEAIFRIVDYLLVPIIPTTLSLRTYESLIAFFLSKKLKRELIVPFFSLVERRKKMHRDIMDVLRARDSRILGNVIPSLSDIEKMGLYKRPLFTYRHCHNADEAYRCLWDECDRLFRDGAL